MHSLALTVGPDRADIGLVLSAALITENPAGSADGRGLIRLFNVDDNSTVYLAFGDTEPGAAESGVPLPIGGEFSEDIHNHAGRRCVGLGPNKTGTKLQAVVVGWS